MIKDWQSEYELAEAENSNLRAALAFVAARLSVADKDELERRLDETIEKGGVTGTTAEDERHEAVELLVKLVAHTERLVNAERIVDAEGRRLQSTWFARLDQLLTEARGYEPKHPLMRRVGGDPNVFAAVKDINAEVAKNMNAQADMVRKWLKS